ncbi:MAG: sigma-70 family RNA polymerase sigma factor [Chloroflexi bacterium]|nr:sigma-70 family RNA polymerase sigma factor [Chloroflexota bacterium]
MKGSLAVTISTQANESELVSKAQNGDRNAYGELVRTHSQGVLNVVYRMCGNSDLAEDAAQEAFIQAWLKISSYQKKASFKSWLYRIAVNAAVDMLRKEKRILPNTIEDLNLSDSRPSPESLLASSEKAELIRGAVLSLPNASRAVLVLREYEGLSYQEIAESLEIPIGTVMSRLSYARKLLKEKLETHFFSYAEVENV